MSNILIKTNMELVVCIQYVGQTLTKILDSHISTNTLVNLINLFLGCKKRNKDPSFIQPLMLYMGDYGMTRVDPRYVCHCDLITL